MNNVRKVITAAGVIQVNQTMTLSGPVDLCNRWRTDYMHTSVGTREAYFDKVELCDTKLLSRRAK